MAKDIIYKTVLVSGDETVISVESFYIFTDTKDGIEFTKDKIFKSYGNKNPEDDTLIPEFVVQIQALFTIVKGILLNSIVVPDGVIFHNVSMRVEDQDFDTEEGKGTVDLVESQYVLTIDGITITKSKTLTDLLSEELKANIQTLFDQGLALTKAREGIS